MGRRARKKTGRKKTNKKSTSSASTKGKQTLSAMRERFCQEYMVDFNGKAAAIRAGYSKKSAHVQASNMLKDEKVRGRIRVLQAEHQHSTRITTERLIDEIRKTALSNLYNYYHTMRRCDTLREFADELSADEMACIKKIVERSTKDGGTYYSIELHDKLRAEDMLMRHFGLYNDKLNLNDTRQAPIADLDLPLETKREVLAAVRKWQEQRDKEKENGSSS